MTELDRIKDEVAKEHGCSINWYIFKGVPGFAIDEIAKRYATACVKASQKKTADAIDKKKSKFLSPERYQGSQIARDIVNDPDNIVLL